MKKILLSLILLSSYNVFSFPTKTFSLGVGAAIAGAMSFGTSNTLETFSAYLKKHNDTAIISPALQEKLAQFADWRATKAGEKYTSYNAIAQTLRSSGKPAVVIQQEALPAKEQE